VWKLKQILQAPSQCLVKMGDTDSGTTDSGNMFWTYYNGFDWNSIFVFCYHLVIYSQVSLPSSYPPPVYDSLGFLSPLGKQIISNDSRNCCNKKRVHHSNVFKNKKRWKDLNFWDSRVMFHEWYTVWDWANKFLDLMLQCMKFGSYAPYDSLLTEVSGQSSIHSLTS
jgi:hypothetical protein